jgi:hypothetical protein
VSDPAELSERAQGLLQDPRTAGDPEALSQVIQWLDEAMADTPFDHPGRVSRLSNLGIALQTRFSRTGAAADLDRAVDVGAETVAAAGPDHPNLARYLGNLGAALQTRFTRTGVPADLDRAVDLGDAALEATPPDHPNRPGRMSNLANTLSVRFAVTGSLSDLDRAVEVGTAAVAAAPPEHPNLPRYLSNLGGTLQTRFRRTGSLADLDRAVEVGTAAVAAALPEHPNLSLYLSNLSGTLQTRFGRIGALADLDRAIEHSEAAVAAAPVGRPDRPRCLSNLGGALGTRYARTGALTDLDRAVDAGTEALALTPQAHPDHVMYLANLGVTLQHRFEHTGAQTDLDRAVDLSEQAVAGTPPDHPNRAVRLSNLGTAFLARFGRTAEPADLDRAVELGTAAVAAVPSEHPGRALYLANLGDALRARFASTHQPADRTDAIAVYRESLHHRSGTPINRAHAGRSAATLAAGQQDWAGAEADLLAVLELLPVLTDHGLGPQDRQHHLAQLQGLAADTVSATLAAELRNPYQRVSTAWQRLEQTRTILLTQALETRHTVEHLRSIHPQLADEYEDLRRVLTDPDDLAGPGGTAAGRLAAQAVVERRMAAAARWPQLFAEIRQVPGFEDFAAPPRPETLHAAAGDGTVVALVASEHGSGALLLTGTEADYLPLPDLTVADARANAIAFLAALNPPPDQPVNNADVTRVLRWMWDTVAGPVLTRLGCTAGPGDPDAPQVWPRIWWIATGPLSVLPIHAAGHHDDPPATRRAVLDRVVSSYAPSVRALADARRTEREPGRDVLAVGINQTADPASPALPRAEREAHAVALHLEAAGTALVGPSATLDAVRARLGAAAWAHFSCHGRADDNDPARSFLDLYDEPLLAGELFTLHPVDPYLAYLSACTTAVGSFRLLDESVHLASAFQLAGYPHVIATLWWVNDVVSTRLSTAVYGAIHPNPHSWRPPAHALHRAVHALRDRYRDNPQVWAAHIHLGP